MSIRRPGRIGPAEAVARAAATAALLACMAAPAAAHRPRPAQLIGELRTSAEAAALGVVEVDREPRLERLLVIRVDRDRWDARPAKPRREFAERWLRTWRQHVAQGIVAIVDADSGDVLVGFGPQGRARLH